MLVLAQSALCEDTPSEPRAREELNEKYLDPELDVSRWTELFETESRELFRAREAIVNALGLQPGNAIGDIGAGTGLFVGPFARAVGSAGTVYAVDISPRFVTHLRERARREGLDRVRVIQSSETSAALPEASLDLAFLCDVYHHFTYPQTMLADLHRALRPGGVLVVIDFERIPGTSRDWIVEHVRAGKAEFIREIESAGFRLEKELRVPGLVENYVLRFRR